MRLTWGILLRPYVVRFKKVAQLRRRATLMSGDQELNSLSRFRKRAGRLVLEEHGHCEAPAGCGGVVLRWRNPLSAVPLTLHLYTPVSAACFLDGVEVRDGQADLAPGRHVAAFILENVDQSAGLIMFTAIHRPGQKEFNLPVTTVESALEVVTADDGSWKCSVADPATDDWKMPAFDDRAWCVLTATPAPQLDPHTPAAWQSRKCVQYGAAFLGLPAPTRETQAASWWRRFGAAKAPPPRIGRVWIRKAFEIPLPQSSKP